MKTLPQIAMVPALLGALVTPMRAQDSTVEVTRLTDRLYLLSTDQGEYTTNTIASVGSDGVLLVDTQAPSDAVALYEAVEALGGGMPKFIINTHRHAEHVGGNAIFGDAPVVIAHDLVPTKLRHGNYLFDEFPAATFPDITLVDSLTLFFNGERIRIVALPGSHDDNEIIVHFTDSKVVHLSSLVNGFNFPSVDADGDALSFPRLIERAIELLPEDVTIVSGHNAVGSVQDLHTYHDMLMQTTAAVRAGLAEGKDLATLQEEGALDAWSQYAGSYVSVAEWTEYLVEALQRTPDGRPSAYDPLYAVWKNDGAAAAVDRYFALRHDHAEDYRFSDITLLVIGMKLLDRDIVPDAVTFLNGSLREQADTDSDYLYYTHYLLADAYDRLGNLDPALQHCETALELNPGFEAAAALLERLHQR